MEKWGMNTRALRILPALGLIVSALAVIGMLFLPPSDPAVDMDRAETGVIAEPAPVDLAGQR